eukprot:TRINITY_DN6926_c0_g1_i1.p1 TRINITY_DN6926_c0_g1~~TRINITY_DN6926_c0_g1_i1.p1  ORF type:complete len:256 (-),score=32.38 TRINITY_DN6926_c0_g1_i1:217-984(-)
MDKRGHRAARHGRNGAVKLHLSATTRWPTLRSSTTLLKASAPPPLKWLRGGSLTFLLSVLLLLKGTTGVQGRAISGTATVSQPAPVPFPQQVLTLLNSLRADAGSKALCNSTLLGAKGKEWIANLESAGQGLKDCPPGVVTLPSSSDSPACFTYPLFPHTSKAYSGIVAMIAPANATAGDPQATLSLFDTLNPTTLWGLSSTDAGVASSSSWFVLLLAKDVKGTGEYCEDLSTETSAVPGTGNLFHLYREASVKA